MKVKNYSSPDGTAYREILSRQYCALRELEYEYQKRGNKTWVNLYSACDGLWMLTVQLIAEAA